MAKIAGTKEELFVVLKPLNKRILKLYAKQSIGKRREQVTM